MKHLTFLLTILATTSVFSQVTQNPKIDRKSAQNVFINKIEITAENTVFHMQFYDKSANDDLEQMYKANPGIMKRFEDMGLSKEQAERFLKERFGGGEQTISFQPGSKVFLSDGQAFKFIKAVNIPVSPERQVVDAGKKYFFKVYFERIPAGFEKIDLIENEADSEGTLQYWNFTGIHINNPKNRQPAIDSPVEEEVLKASNFRLFGKIINAETNTPIHAKIICVDTRTGKVIDSLQTSKTGKYEFILDSDEVAYTVRSNGFYDLQESINLKFFLKAGQFEKDIFLDPKDALSLDTLHEVPEIKQVDREEKSTSIGEQLDENATSFKLDKVYFDIGMATILQESHTQLDNLVDHLKENPELKIQIEGHTDNQGDAKANQKLSIDRAFNVRQYLIAKGIDSKRIRFKGYGSTKPVAPNDSEENRSKNRRVEYTFMD
jgi:OOP family OmpA-OmpF porin